MAEELEVKIKIEGQSVKSILDGLRDVKRSANDVEESINDLNTELKDSSEAADKFSDSVKDIAKSNDNLSKTFEDVYGELKPLSSRLGELEDRMYEMALAGQSGTEEFETLRLEAVRMRQTIIEVDKQVDILADNKGFSVFSDGIGSVGASLSRLDFDTAAKQAQGLAVASSKISFGGAVKSLKQLGSTLLNLGKALLTNPLFLMAAVVTAIIAAIVKLMDELGILTAIFEAIGDAIGWVIQKIKDFLDWLGLTDYAGEEYAQKQIDRNKRLQESYQEKTDAEVAGLDHEIAMRKARGEETEQLEREKLILLQKSADEQVRLAKETAIHIMKLKGKDSDEFKEQAKAIKDLEKMALQSRRNIELFEVTKEEESKKRDEANKKASIDRAKKHAEDQKRIQEEIAKARLAADIMIQEANIMAIEDEIERERVLGRFKEEQSFKQIDLTKLTQSQVEELTRQHNDRLQAIDNAALEKVNAKKNEENDKVLQAQKDFEKMLFDLREETAAKQIEAFERVQDEEVDKLRMKYDQGLIDLDQFEAGKTAIVDKYSREIDKIRDEEAQKELERQKAVKEGALDLASGVLAGVQSNLKEGGKAAKAVAVAQATMDTYRAAVAAFASTASSPISIAFPAAPYIAAASAVAMGIANVRKILAVDNSGNGGGGTPSATGGQAPSFGSPQQAPQTPNMNLNNGIEQNAGGSVKREKVIVVDYHDIQDKGNELNKMKQKVTLQ